MSAAKKLEVATSSVSATFAAKLVAVFGVGSKLTATYTEKNVSFTDGATTLKFDLPAGEPSVAVGTYDVTVASPEVVEQTFAATQPAAAKAAAKQASPAARQGCSVWDEKEVF